MLSLRPGQVELRTQDYKGHGTTSLFAALEVATGAVTTAARERHTAADFLAFLRQVARAYPRRQIHVILDNVSTHKTPAIECLAAPSPALPFPSHPTSASWLNQVET